VEAGLDTAELARAVAQIRWWHRLDLGNGLETPGRQDSQAKLRTLSLPEDLSGLSVLDIGTWDGFFAFEAERRGASRVVAIDSPELNWGGQNGGTREGFDLARRVLRSGVLDREISVLALDPSTVGEFDLVLALGVIYHMVSPLQALSRIAHVTRDLLILDTHVEFIDFPGPVMRFFPGRELGDDPTNWWGPNPAAITAMLRVVGFQQVEVVHLARRSRGSGIVQASAPPAAVAPGSSDLELLGESPGRLVVHARRLQRA
jgi:tRNA (mo5U34)-methyltransferase